MVVVESKPKVELNENNLLSGFMSEFGKAINNKIGSNTINSGINGIDYSK